MTEKYYVDTSIWMDLVEDRKGYNDEPLGDYALKLFAMIKAKKRELPRVSPAGSTRGVTCWDSVSLRN